MYWKRAQKISLFCGKSLIIFQKSLVSSTAQYSSYALSQSENVLKMRIKYGCRAGNAGVVHYNVSRQNSFTCTELYYIFALTKANHAASQLVRCPTLQGSHPLYILRLYFSSGILYKFPHPFPFPDDIFTSKNFPRGSLLHARVTAR